jgi:hypothetical protein
LWWRIFPVWQAGVACLCWGFSHGFSPLWLVSGALLLCCAGLALLWHAGYGLWHSPARDATSQGLRLALAGLGLALALGLLLVLTLGGDISPLSAAAAQPRTVGRPGLAAGLAAGGQPDRDADVSGYTGLSQPTAG